MRKKKYFKYPGSHVCSHVGGMRQRSNSSPSIRAGPSHCPVLAQQSSCCLSKILRLTLPASLAVVEKLLEGRRDAVGHHYSALPAPHSHPSAPFDSQAVAYIQPGDEVFRSLREKQLKTFSEVCAYFFPAEPIKAEKESPVIEERLT